MIDHFTTIGLLDPDFNLLPESFLRSQQSNAFAKHLVYRRKPTGGNEAFGKCLQIA